MERTNKGKLVILSKCAVCDTKNSIFIKKQEASGLLSYWGLKIPLSKNQLLCDTLF